MHNFSSIFNNPTIFKKFIFQNTFFKTKKTSQMTSPYLSIGDKRWLSRVSFGNLKVSKTKAKSVSVFEKLPDGSSRILQLQVPWTNTFGAQKQTFDDSKEKYSMTLIFPSGGDGDAELQKSVENLGEFENLMKGQAEQNSMDWFNKKMTPEIINAFMVPTLRYSKDGTKGPYFQVKMPYWENEFKLEVFNQKHELIFPNTNPNQVDSIISLVPRGKVAVILECGGIWMAGGKFGSTWKAKQILVEETKQLLGVGKCQISYAPAEIQAPVEAPAAAAAATGAAAVEEAPDSDEERDPFAEPENTETTKEGLAEAPMKGKKKVVKKN
jgi:hypothetical protein